MTLYSRRQLALLLAVVALAGLGLAVGHARRTHPEVVERLERFDHTPPPPATPRAPATPLAPATAPPERSPTSGSTDAPPPRPIDLNRAPPGELTRLPGIGPVLATRIVEARDAGGPFASVEDLRRVRGLSPSTLDRLRPLVTVE